MPSGLPRLNLQAKEHASRFRVLVLIGVAAAFRTAFLPHMTESSVASKLAEANHPVVVPPQWLPMILAAYTPVATTNGRRLSNHNVFATRAELITALKAWNSNPNDAEATYGPIDDFDVSGITDMSWLFTGLHEIDEDIPSWDTSGVTNMERMFAVRALAQPPGPSLHAANTAAAHRPHPTHRSV